MVTEDGVQNREEINMKERRNISEMFKSEPKLTLVEGRDKSVSLSMKWIINENQGVILRTIGSGSINASSFLKKTITWQAFDKNGSWLFIPKNIRRHERSIAKWLITLKS